MAYILKGSHSFTCTPHVHPLTGRTIPAFAFPAEGGTHLPTLEGWKAELALKLETCVLGQMGGGSKQQRGWPWV